MSPGVGKELVVAMFIVWNVLNFWQLTWPRRYSVVDDAKPSL